MITPEQLNEWERLVERVESGVWFNTAEVLVAVKDMIDGVRELELANEQLHARLQAIQY